MSFSFFQVLSVSTLSKCLAKCLTAKQTLGMDCQSVMYFYESESCILNRERRQSVDRGIFRPEKGTELVDYLENVCVDGKLMKMIKKQSKFALLMLSIWKRVSHLYNFYHKFNSIELSALRKPTGCIGYERNTFG